MFETGNKKIVSLYYLYGAMQLSHRQSVQYSLRSCYIPYRIISMQDSYELINTRITTAQTATNGIVNERRVLCPHLTNGFVFFHDIVRPASAGLCRAVQRDHTVFFFLTSDSISAILASKLMAAGFGSSPYGVESFKLFLNYNCLNSET